MYEPYYSKQKQLTKDEDIQIPTDSVTRSHTIPYRVKEWLRAVVARDKPSTWRRGGIAMIVIYVLCAALLVGMCIQIFVHSQHSPLELQDLNTSEAIRQAITSLIDETHISDLPSATNAFFMTERGEQPVVFDASSRGVASLLSALTKPIYIQHPLSRTFKAYGPYLPKNLSTPIPGDPTSLEAARATQYHDIMHLMPRYTQAFGGSNIGYKIEIKLLKMLHEASGDAIVSVAPATNPQDINIFVTHAYAPTP